MKVDCFVIVRTKDNVESVFRKKYYTHKKAVVNEMVSFNKHSMDIARNPNASYWSDKFKKEFESAVFRVEKATLVVGEEL